jgi:hypothetical protein
MSDQDAALEQAIPEVVEGMIARMDAELMAKSQPELAADWWFRWDDKQSIERNVYEFAGCLEHYRRECRQWEERYNGLVCVVERVRDRYLMPRIREFLDVLERKMEEA